MMHGTRRQQVMDEYRRYIEGAGMPPSLRHVGDKLGITAPAVYKHRQALLHEGKLVYTNGRLDLPGRIDLAEVSTQAMRAELARRGETFDALMSAPIERGRYCAAHHCATKVQPGRLFCRDHWFALPPAMRSDIMNAWRARATQAYGEAVEAARNHLGGFAKVSEIVR
jgi:hypothetical protein